MQYSAANTSTTYLSIRNHPSCHSSSGYCSCQYLPPVHSVHMKSVLNRFLLMWIHQHHLYLILSIKSLHPSRSLQSAPLLLQPSWSLQSAPLSLHLSKSLQSAPLMLHPSLSLLTLGFRTAKNSDKTALNNSIVS